MTTRSTFNSTKTTVLFFGLLYYLKQLLLLVLLFLSTIHTFNFFNTQLREKYNSNGTVSQLLVIIF